MTRSPLAVAALSLLACGGSQRPQADLHFVDKTDLTVARLCQVSETGWQARYRSFELADTTYAMLTPGPSGATVTINDQGVEAVTVSGQGAHFVGRLADGETFVTLREPWRTDWIVIDHGWTVDVSTWPSLTLRYAGDAFILLDEPITTEVTCDQLTLRNEGTAQETVALWWGVEDLGRAWIEQGDVVEPGGDTRGRLIGGTGGQIIFENAQQREVLIETRTGWARVLADIEEEGLLYGIGGLGATDPDTSQPAVSCPHGVPLYVSDDQNEALKVGWLDPGTRFTPVANNGGWTEVIVDLSWIELTRTLWVATHVVDACPAATQ